MLFPIQDVIPTQDVPCKQDLIPVIPRYLSWRGEKRGRSPGDKGAELHGQSQPFPAQTAFFLRLIPEARYGPG